MIIDVIVAIIIGALFGASFAYAFGYMAGLSKGEKNAAQQYAKPAEEALKKAEETLHKLHAKQEEYNVAIAAVRQAYVSYMERGEEPSKEESSRLQ